MRNRWKCGLCGTERDRFDINCPGCRGNKAPRYEDQTGHVSHPLRSYTSAERKDMPLQKVLSEYFPDAFMALARLSRKANEKHNPGEPMHWARNKSTDHLDCAARHLLTPNAVDPDTGEIELVAALWRCAAALQLAEEKRLVSAGIMPLSGVTD